MSGVHMRVPNLAVQSAAALLTPFVTLSD